MMGAHESDDKDMDEFSDDKFWDNIDWEAFDLIGISEIERQQLVEGIDNVWFCMAACLYVC